MGFLDRNPMGRRHDTTKRTSARRRSKVKLLEQLEARHLLALFVVNDLRDLPDTTAVGDGIVDADASQPGHQVSLRGAIQETNALAGADSIELPAGIFDLSISGAGEDAAVSGDLDILDTLQISGAGISQTVISANQLDRVFDAFGVSFELNRMTLMDGETTGDGGAVRQGSGQLVLNETTLKNNVAAGSGGAVSGAGDVFLTKSSLLSNSALQGGGLVANDAIIDSSTIAHNHADGNGGGILALGEVQIENSTISTNLSDSLGGGIYDASSFAQITSSTIALNASTEGGGIYTTTGIDLFWNSIVAQNSDSGGAPDIFGNVGSQGFNLVSDDQGSTGLGAFGDLFGSGSPMDAHLGPLGNYGGLTETHLLLPPSPAIDAGDDNATPVFDQRGQARIADGDGDGTPENDMGALERQPLQLVVSTHDFVIDEPHDVAFEIFNVVVPGPMTIDIAWDGTSTLEAELEGRRRESLPDPTTPYALDSGSSALQLVYNVTQADIERGVSWRVVVQDDAGAHDATGTITITKPTQSDTDFVFQREKIPLRGGDLWPNDFLDQSFRSKLGGLSSDGLHGILTMKRVCSCVDVFQLEQAGIHTQSFVTPRHSVGLVDHDADLSATIVQQALRALTPLEPEDKIDPHILVGNYTNFDILVDGQKATPGLLIDGLAIGKTNTVRRSDGSLDLLVDFHEDATRAQVESALTSVSIGFSEIDSSVWSVQMTPANLVSLAESEFVESIDEGQLPILPDLVQTRMQTNVDLVQNPRSDGMGNLLLTDGAPVYDGFSGEGIVIGIFDNGVRADHPDFAGAVVSDGFLSQRHGTHVAGIAAGSGFQSDKLDLAGDLNTGTPFQFRGVAPNADIMDGTAFFHRSEMSRGARHFSLDVANLSQSTNTDGTYNGMDQFVDEFAAGRSYLYPSASGVPGGSRIPIEIPRKPTVFSAGNGGTAPQFGNLFGYFSTTKQTKNGIVVGNWNNTTLNFGSSMGPTHDGRVKPDIVAPGTNVNAASFEQNERQTIFYNNNVLPTTGSFTITFTPNGGGAVETTIPIAVHSDASTVESALEALPSIDDVSVNAVNVDGGQVSSYQIEFRGNQGNRSVQMLGTADIGMDATTVVVQNLQGVAHDSYLIQTGTSMAAPAVSGIVALMLEAWQTTYADAYGTNIDDAGPFPSTLRALLIQTATDVVDPNVMNFMPTMASGTGHPEIDSDSDPSNGNDARGLVTATAGPDFSTGWGQVDAQAAINMLTNTNGSATRPIPRQIVQSEIAQGEVVEFDFVVGPSSGDFKLTLAWDDPSPSRSLPRTAPRLVNDLDLELRDPNGNIFLPWQLGHTIHAADDPNGPELDPAAQPPGTDIVVNLPFTPNGSNGNEVIPASALTGSGQWVARMRGRDHLNNVEQVFIPASAATSGHWTARIIGFDISEGPNQDFSLVGIPAPDLPDLAVQAIDRVALSAFDEDLTFSWKALNRGAAPSTVSNVDYRIYLSKDFVVDPDDRVLADTTYLAIPTLGVGAEVTRTSTVRIQQADADHLLGPASTPRDLIDNDVFLIVEVDSSDAVLEPNETNTASLQLARPVDVVFVLDRSGSMDANVTTSVGNRQKMEMLKDSANLFLDLMRLDGTDKLGQISFNADATVDSDPDDPDTATSAANALNVLDSTTIDAARTNVNSLGTGGKTDIEDALSKALIAQTALLAPERRKVVVFLSDGRRNDGNDPLALLPNLSSNNIRVYSVGFGTAGESGRAGIDVELLQALSNVASDGFFHVTDDPLELDKFFVNALAGATRIDQIVDPIGTLAPGQETTIPIAMNSRDRRVTFTTTWDTPSAVFETRLRSPGGYEIRPAEFASFGELLSHVRGPSPTAETYDAITLYLPLQFGADTEHSGEWEMIVRNVGTTTARYSASALSQSTIHMEVPAPQPAGLGFGSGEVVTLAANLTTQGLSPLSTSNVEYTATVPPISLGDFLASHPVTAAELAAVDAEPNNDLLSEQERRFIALVRRLGFDPLQPIELPSRPLVQSTPGQFAATFTETRHDGTYQFLVGARGITDDCEPFQREWTTSVGRPPVIAPAPPTDPKVPTPGSGGDVVITVGPRTVGGTLAGPGLTDIAIIADGLEPVEDLLDNGDGTYSQLFLVPDGASGEITVTTGAVTSKIPSVDTTVTPSTMVPPGGTNTAPEFVSIGFVLDANGPNDPSTPAGVILKKGSLEVKLQNVDLDESNNQITGNIPAGLDPGIYSVRLETAHGQSRIADVTYEVVGADHDFSPEVVALGKTFRELAKSETESTVSLLAGQLISQLNQIPTGPALDEATRQAALDELIQGIVAPDMIIAPSMILATMRMVTAAQIDARFVDHGPIFTEKGLQSFVDLGNGNSLTFGEIAVAGETTIEYLPGPEEFAKELRGSPHVLYRINTTAGVPQPEPPSLTSLLQISYQDSDFTDENQLRLLHDDNGIWRDVTVNVNTKENTVTAQIPHLSDFVLVQGNPLPVVTGIMVGSSEWNKEFREIIDPENGIGLRVDFGANQLKSVSQSINEIYVQFSEPVTGFDESNVELYGVNQVDYAALIASIEMNDTLGKIKLHTSIRNDKLLLRLNANSDIRDFDEASLDGEWITAGGATQSGNGAEGGVFNFRVNVLSGDADGSGSNSLNDLQILATNWQQSVNQSNFVVDFDGSGFISLSDLQTLATNWQQSLPQGEPGIPLPARAEQPPRRTRDFGLKNRIYALDKIMRHWIDEQDFAATIDELNEDFGNRKRKWNHRLA